VIAKDPIEPPIEPRNEAPTEPRIALELEEVPCPLGCAGSDRLVLEGFDRLQGLPGRFRVVECASCGLLRTNPRPTPESMSFYYGAGYLPYRSSRPRARLGA
jgi:hypothetical protein